jgi:hypothetical protein
MKIIGKFQTVVVKGLPYKSPTGRATLLSNLRFGIWLNKKSKSPIKN